MTFRVKLLRLYASKLYHTWKNRGVSGVVTKVWSFIDNSYQYRKYVHANKLSPQEVEVQCRHAFQYNPQISIIVPLFNTPALFIKELIESVLAQTYSNWQLCFADGSDQDYQIANEMIHAYALTDQRIIYQKLDSNHGISGNSNQAITMASGAYLALLDHDDMLACNALFEVVKVINETEADMIYSDELSFVENIDHITNIHFKPDFAIDNLRSNNYICHLSVFSMKLLDMTGFFRSEYDGSQDYDLILRLSENASKIVHIPKVLYYWRVHPNSVAADISAKPYSIISAQKALSAHLSRAGLSGTVENSSVISTYRIKYEISGAPLISIIIPNKDHAQDLKKCIDSIISKSVYKHFEIIIVENNSTESATFAYYEDLKKHEHIKVVVWEGPFNYSDINNFGCNFAEGAYFLFLNNDTEVITSGWLEEMLMFAQRPDVGAVGAKLYYRDGTVQHAGIGIGLLTLAGHYFRYRSERDPGYMGRLSYAQNVSAVTAACLMMKKKDFRQINGFDPSLAVAFNDVDLCLRIRQNGLLIVFTPYAELYHFESKSRGLDSSKLKRARFIHEVNLFRERWKDVIAQGDPYYNINLTLDDENFSVK